ncbi:MAG: hypothetical protein ABI461_14055 [Polyangiaceae bacterium]
MSHRRLVLLASTFLLPAASLAYGCGSGTDNPGISTDAGKAGETKDGSSFGGDTGAFEDSGEEPITDSGSTRDTGADARAWPDCNTQPTDAPTRSISDIWTANANAPKLSWIPSVTISAISFGGCNAGHACQIFLQTDATYATLADGAHKAIKMFISAAAATHFSTASVGDTVNAMGWGWRYNLDNQNEILLEVNNEYQGCVKKTGTLALTPVQNVRLDQLTLDNYENQIGPLLIQVNDVRGTTSPDLAQTFGLVPRADGGYQDAGPEIVSLSPFFLVGGTFSAPIESSSLEHFTSITGVFGLFNPTSDAGTKYDEIYPRTNADLVTF